MKIVYYFQIYPTPVGDLCIVADVVNIKMIYFIDNDAKKYLRQNSVQLTNKMTQGIQNVINFFERYFIKQEMNEDIKIVLMNNTKINVPKKYSKDTKKTILLDIGGFTQKEMIIYQVLMNTGFGETISYHSLAEKAGVSRGARFAGNTMKKNRFPIIIPCHRVIKSDNTIGNYSGGVAKKKLLLSHES